MTRQPLETTPRQSSLGHKVGGDSPQRRRGGAEKSNFRFEISNPGFQMHKPLRFLRALCASAVSYTSRDAQVKRNVAILIFAFLFLPLLVSQFQQPAGAAVKAQR